MSGVSAATRQWVADVSLASFDSHVNLSSIQLERREVGQRRTRKRETEAPVN